jgi:hypothetical protein
MPAAEEQKRLSLSPTSTIGSSPTPRAIREQGVEDRDDEGRKVSVSRSNQQSPTEDDRADWV